MRHTKLFMVTMGVIGFGWPYIGNAQSQGLSIEKRGNATVVHLPSGDATPFFQIEQLDGQPIAVGPFKTIENSGNVAPAGFSQDGAILVQQATGVRFPAEVAGCRRGAVQPNGTGASGGTDASNALVEYDCPRGAPLSYVIVRVLRFDQLRFDAKSAAVMAQSVTQLDTQAAGIPCYEGQATPGTPNADLVNVQCGARWRRPSKDKSAYGTATVGLAAPHVFIGFTNTCVEAQCSNRPAFGAFVTSFDLTSMKRD